jgi:hypothetical protein
MLCYFILILLLFVSLSLAAAALPTPFSDSSSTSRQTHRKFHHLSYIPPWIPDIPFTFASTFNLQSICPLCRNHFINTSQSTPSTTQASANQAKLSLFSVQFHNPALPNSIPAITGSMPLLILHRNPIFKSTTTMAHLPCPYLQTKPSNQTCNHLHICITSHPLPFNHQISSHSRPHPLQSQTNFQTATISQTMNQFNQSSTHFHNHCNHHHQITTRPSPTAVDLHSKRDEPVLIFSVSLPCKQK